MAPANPILVINCGSSSVKLAVLDPDTGERAVTALAERIATDDVSVQVTRASEASGAFVGRPDDSSLAGVLGYLFQHLSGAELAALAGVGHRVVHGGSRFSASVLIDDEVRAALDGLTELAPLHVPANLAGIDAARAALPGLPQVAVFDTAFHQSMPPRAYRYAVPTSWYADHGVRRYGFHGTSHRYVSRRAAEQLARPVTALRLVTVHLGNGCSAAAVRDGVSVDTTMGLTPLEGLVMGSRSGDVDPGVLGYIGARLGLSLAAVLDLLNTRSGLLGLSGLSNDMRTLQQSADAGDQAAALAIDVFCYRVAKAVAALAVPLGRLDALVFTGGIGEHSAPVRAAVLAQLEVLGLAEDPAANAEHGRGTGGRVSALSRDGTSNGDGAAGRPLALVVATDEEREIARDTWELIR